MPWYRVAYRPQVIDDLSKVDQSMAQRLFDKTKWLASNVENLRHEPLDPDLPGLSHYAVGDWRILYSIDRDEQILDVHLVGTSRDVYDNRPRRPASPGP